MEQHYNNPQGISKSLLVFNGILVALIILMFFVIYGETNKPKPVALLEEQEVYKITPFDNLTLMLRQCMYTIY